MEIGECKLGAVSYKLLAVSCELKAEAYFPLGVIRNISKGFAVVVRETLNVILNERGGSIPMVRKALRRHQSHRFFTRCHVAVSRLSYTAFLRPFRMTVGRKGVIIRGTLIVIRSGGEKFMEELVKTVKRKS